MISVYLYAVYSLNSRDVFLTACGEHVIPLVMVPLYFIVCLEVDHILHLQSVQVRRDRSDRKQDQVLTELLLPSDFGFQYD